MRAFPSGFTTRVTCEVVKVVSSAWLFERSHISVRRRHDLFFRLDKSFVFSGAFSEAPMSGTGDLALNADWDSKYYVWASTVGTRRSICFGCNASDARSISINYMLGLCYRLKTSDHGVNLRFAGAPTGLDSYVSRADIVKRSVIFGLGIAVKPVSGLDVSLVFDGFGEVSNLPFNGRCSVRLSGSF